MGQTGILRWQEGPNRLFLAFDDGRLVDYTPHLAKRLLGRSTWRLVDLIRRDHPDAMWMPTGTPPRRFQPHLEQTEPLQRWKLAGVNFGVAAFVTFGKAGDGWYVLDTREPHAWSYRDRSEAEADLAWRMSNGEWVRMPARHDASGALPDPDGYDLDPGDTARGSTPIS